MPELDELGIARAMAAGDLPSPQHYENLWLFAIRITGTGAAYRTVLGEHVWRNAGHYLNDDFLARCNGLPVILDHPPTGTLDGDEYRERGAGAIMLAFIRGDEVWGIARIYDDALATMLQDETLSTSPCVVFRDGQTTDMGNGEHLLVEGAPRLLDHIAICAAGVWDKGGPPSGIDSPAAEEPAMAEKDKAAERDDAAETETEKEEREDSARLDAAHNDLMTKLDAISAKLDSAHSRLDAFEKERADKARKDAAEEKDEKKEEREDAEEKDGADKERADKERKDTKGRKDKSFGEWAEEEKEEPEHRDDAETEEEKMALKKAEEAKDDKARKDAAARADAAEKEARNLKAELAEIRQMLRREVSAEERDELAAAQSRADSVMALFGKRAPLPNVGETLLGYRRRLLRPLMQHSTHLKDARVDSADAATLDLIERQVFADARDASRVRADAHPGMLVPRTSTDAAGRTITTYEGDMLAWLAPFMTDGARCIINRNPNGR